MLTLAAFSKSGMNAPEKLSIVTFIKSGKIAGHFFKISRSGLFAFW
jgi:hypothetical protein